MQAVFLCNSAFDIVPGKHIYHAHSQVHYRSLIYLWIQELERSHSYTTHSHRSHSHVTAVLPSSSFPRLVPTMLSTALPITSKRTFRPRLRGCYAVKEQHEQSHQFAPSLAQRRESGDVRAGAVQDSLSLNLTPTLDAVHQQGAAYQPALYTTQQEEEVAAPQQVADASRSAQATPPPNNARSALRDIATLSIPALGSVLADPICSLADTACVGQAGHSVQLAALSPCTAIFNLVFLVRPFKTYVIRVSFVCSRSVHLLHASETLFVI